MSDFFDKLFASYKRSDKFTEEHNCPRGRESTQDGRAVWTMDDSCSYCGSLHPDLLMERLEAGTVTLDPTDKSYKIYVHANPGSEQFITYYRDSEFDPGGGDPSKWIWTSKPASQCKFYFQHLSNDQMLRFIELLNDKKLKLNYPGHFYVTPFFISR